LAFEKGEDGAMLRKPRDPKEKIFNKLMIQQTLTAGFTMGTIGLIVWYYLVNYTTYEIESARNILLLLIVFMQNFHVFNSRSESISAFKVPISKNYLLIFGVLLASGIHFISMYNPFMQKALRVEPMQINEILICFLIASVVLFVMEIFKKVKKSNKNLK
jgi:magnesium-transporting ATPase (P-type)